MKPHHWSLSVKLISKETLRQFLKFRDMSYGQLADKVGCSKGQVPLSGVVVVPSFCWFGVRR